MSASISPLYFSPSDVAHHSPGCECLALPALFLLCWCCPFFVLQFVSTSTCLLSFFPANVAHPLFFSLWVPLLACSVSLLLMLDPPLSSLWVPLIAHSFSLLLTLPILHSPGCECFCLLTLFLSCWHPYSILFRMWVPLLACSISFLLTLPILCSSVCECLYLLALFLCCWCCLFSALQDVSASTCLLCFCPADVTHPLFTRMWVPLARSISLLLMLPVLCSPGCECLCFLALFLFSWHLLILCSSVCECLCLLCFSPADVTFAPQSVSVFCLLTLFLSCWYCPSFAFKLVNASACLLHFSPADIIHPLLSSLWVHLLAHSVSVLLMLPVLCSPVCECFCWPALFLSCWHHSSSALQSVSASCLFSISLLLMLPIHCSSVCECLHLLLCFSFADVAHPLISSLWAPSLACLSLSIWHHLSSTLQFVSELNYSVFLLLMLPHQFVSASACLLCFSPPDIAHSPLSRVWVPLLACLLCFCPANIAHPHLFRMWVPSLSCSVSLLPMLPILCSPGCECLCFLALFLSCWCCLSSALQSVSASACLLCFFSADVALPLFSSLWVPSLLCFSFAEIAHPPLSSLWVPLLAHCFCPADNPILYSLVGKWLCQLTLFLFWFFALQLVSVFACLLCFCPTDVVFHLLSSLWVPLLACYISLLLTSPILCSPVCVCLCLPALFISCWCHPSSALQSVSVSACSLCFSPADITHPPLSSL